MFPRLTSQPETIRKMRHQLEGKTQEERSRKRKRFLENMVMAHVFLDKPLWSRWQFPKQWPQITRRDWKLSKPLKSRHLKLHPINKLDENFSIYLNHLLSEGIDVPESFKTLAALVDARPDASQKGDLPRARRCLQEWAELDPANRKWAGGCCGSHKVAS